MIRFIMACMVVVALSIFATTAQFMVQGIEGARQEVAARNVEQPEQVATAPEQAAPQEQSVNVAAEEFTTPDMLNNIETAAGADDFPAESFTNQAPAGLEDDEVPAAPVMMTDEAAGNAEAN
ncbi:MAG: hypothetical protein DI626_03160 [Micavibrio aeruginosavorus]|uniref:Uncharacterized protein n=1 Tax=Micavibrio aeruginosavorus TaxID=349221 RepID=A0A2W5A2Q6_9BACT|nr:MAG: hypothetical protein DI626_03160 [Micavibrio aeruginosavorus]